MSPINHREIESCLVDLLNSRQPNRKGGFVVFEGCAVHHFIQYSLEAKGLVLNWPIVDEDGSSKLPNFVAELRASGFTNVADVGSQFDLLQEKTFVITPAPEGLWAHCGSDPTTVATLTQNLMIKVFGDIVQKYELEKAG